MTLLAFSTSVQVLPSTHFKMFLWRLITILLNTWCMVFCVRNPNEIDYAEMSTHQPTLEELRSGNLVTIDTPIDDIITVPLL